MWHNGLPQLSGLQISRVSNHLQPRQEPSRIQNFSTSSTFHQHPFRSHLTFEFLSSYLCVSVPYSQSPGKVCTTREILLRFQIPTVSHGKYHEKKRKERLRHGQKKADEGTGLKPHTRNVYPWPYSYPYLHPTPATTKNTFNIPNFMFS